MSAEVVDFVARLAALKLRPHASHHEDNVATISHGLENINLHSRSSGQVNLVELQSALLDLKAELVKTQAKLRGAEWDVPSALAIGAHAEMILQDLKILAGEIARLKRTT